MKWNCVIFRRNYFDLSTQGWHSSQFETFPTRTLSTFKAEILRAKFNIWSWEDKFEIWVDLWLEAIQSPELKFWKTLTKCGNLGKNYFQKSFSFVALAGVAGNKISRQIQEIIKSGSKHVGLRASKWKHGFTLYCNFIQRLQTRCRLCLLCFPLPLKIHYRKSLFRLHNFYLMEKKGHFAFLGLYGGVKNPLNFEPWCDQTIVPLFALLYNFADCQKFAYSNPHGSKFSKSLEKELAERKRH